MFRGTLRTQERPIGLEVRDHTVRLLQLAQQGERLKAIAAAEVALPDNTPPTAPQYPASLRQALRTALERGGFVGTSVVSCLPHASLTCKNFRLPPMPGDELRAAVQWEADDRFRLGGPSSVQYLYAGEVSQGDEQRLELIVMASRLAEIEAHVDALTDNQLRPLAIDAPPTALAHLLAGLPQPAAADQGRVLLEIDQDVSRVLILRDQRILFYKTIDIAGRQLDSQLAAGLKLPLDQAAARRRELAHASRSDDANVQAILAPALQNLGREIALCLRYFGVTFRGTRPDQAHLLGQAATPWLAQQLSETSGIDVQLQDPLHGIDLAAVRHLIPAGAEPAWAVAAGLSLRPHRSTFRRGAA